jgi:hypothetical protein
MTDMVTFAAAALGHEAIGSIPVPAAITQGFRIAEQPYACAAENPSLGDKNCLPLTVSRRSLGRLRPPTTLMMCLRPLRKMAACTVFRPRWN